MLNVDVSNEPRPNLNVENEGSAPGDMVGASRNRILWLRRENGKPGDLLPGDNGTIVTRSRSRLHRAAARKEGHSAENADAGHRPNENKMRDGGRGRTLLGVEGWKSSQKWSVQRSAVRSIVWLDLLDDVTME